jgi:hypothetical protein
MKKVKELFVLGLKVTQMIFELPVIMIGKLIRVCEVKNG